MPYDIDARADHDRTLSQAKADEHVWGECPICACKTPNPGDYCSQDCWDDHILEMEADAAVERMKEAAP